MAYDGWLELGGTELVNISRTAELAESLGVDIVYTTPESVEWLQVALSQSGYEDITSTPWYDPRTPASREFIGALILSMPGLDDSTASASTTELTTDGGRSGRVRHGSLNLVGSAALLATTARGAEFGKRWFDSVLAKTAGRDAVCSGVELRYFRYADSGVPSEIVNASALTPWYAKDARSSVKRLGVVAGTSIDDGSLASSYDLTWPAQIQSKARTRLGLNGGAGYISATPSTEGAIVPPLPVTSAGTKVMWGHGLGGRAVFIGATTDHVTYSPQPCTRVRVYYGKTSVAGAGMRVLIDDVDQGVTLNSADTVNSGGHVWESGPLTPGDHTVKIVPYNSPYVGVVEGVEFIYRDEDAGFRVYNGGHSGGDVAFYNHHAPMDMHWESVAAMDLDLAVVSLGANDISHLTVEQFLTGIDGIIDRVPGEVPILLLGGYLRGDYNTPEGRAKWSEMQMGLRERAVGQVAYYDIAPHWPVLVADGSTSEGLMYDTPPIHPNTNGMTRMAEILTEVLLVEGPPVAHRRMVRLSRGATVTRKHESSCSHMWTINFTLVADDPFEYGEPVGMISALGGAEASGPGVLDSGQTALTEVLCPTYDFSPVQDPAFPSLIPAPAAPDILPAGWDISAGMTFDRTWALTDVIPPAVVGLVPVITLRTETEARMVRVCIWPGLTDPTVQCEPLFSAVVTYLPPNVDFVIDGEQRVVYTWDGASPVVRRADSLVFTKDARPVDWASFNDPDGLLVSLDVFSDSSGYEGDGDVRVAVAFVPKSD